MKNILPLLSLIVLLISMNACHKPSQDLISPNQSFPPTLIPTLAPPIPWTEITTDSSEGNGVVCITKLVKWGPQYFPEIISLNPHDEIVFPGAVFNYESFQKGTYQPIIGDRKPIIFSASLPGSGVDLVKTIEEPALSNFREALRDMLNPYTGVTPSKLSFTRKEILSEKHFALKIGGNLRSATFDIAAHFNFENSEVKSRLLIEFTQEYYSIDLDIPPPGLENWFDTSLDNEDQLGEFSPVYVSSVRYGRKVFVLVESKTMTYNQLAGLDVNLNGVINGGSLVADQTMNKLLDDRSIKVAVMGGAADSGIKLIESIEQFNEFLHDGANFSSQSPGVPLSYTLRFVANNDIAKLQLYDEFQITECFPNTAEIEVPDLTFLYPKHINGDGEFNSNGPNVEVKVWLKPNNSNKELWLYTTFSLKEIGGDSTEGLGGWEKLVYVAPGNRKIHSVVTDNYSEWIFEDTDDALNTLNLSEEDIVRKIEVMGDTAGDDLGGTDANHSFLSVYFNPINIKLY